MRHWIWAAGMAVAMSAATAMAEEEYVTTPEDQTGLALTIYAQGLGLVKDRREVALIDGEQAVAFEGVSAGLIPSSALLRGGDGVSLLEQNLEYDVLSPQTLLERSVGRTVRVARVHPTTGEDLIEEAEVLAAENGVVLKIGDRIEAGMPGRLIFESVPQDLRPKPTLVMRVQSAAAASSALELSYLTEGLTWRADYAAELAPDGKSLDLSGWASLGNTTNTDFANAEVQLIAGDVRREAAKSGARMLEAAPARAVAAPMTMVADMGEEAVGDVHLYTLPRTVTLKNRQTKQIALMSSSGVPVAREYLYEHWLPPGKQRAFEPPAEHPHVRLSFENAESSGLGAALPGGLVRVYERDSRGRIQFTGERSIRHTPEGDTVRLALGQAFDLTIRNLQTDHRQQALPQRTFESAHEVTIENAKDDAVTVTVVEHFPGDWTILEESHVHEKSAAGQARWQIPVPAKGTATLAFRVQVSRPR